MKTKIFSLFLMLTISIGTLFASNTSVGGIWYNFQKSTLTATVTYRGSSYGEYGLEYSNSIVIPSSVRYDGEKYNVTGIGYDAFRECKDLTSVTIPSSVTSIGDNAFMYCTGLTSITIPNSVTSIGKEAFSGCYSLPVVDNLRYADTYLVVAVNKSLPTYTIKDGTTWIGYAAFSGCSLTSVEIPNSVTSIETGAFLRCTHLTSVTIPNSVTSIGWQAFEYCTSLTSVEIPNSVTSIGSVAFSHCPTLTSVTIGSGTTNIGTSIFEGCTGLISVAVDNNNSTYDSRNNCNAIIETATNTLIAGCKNSIIPNTVSSIWKGAFIECASLNTIEIPNSVTGIGRAAFKGCAGLTSVTIGSGVTSIGDEAFWGCIGLTSVEISNSVTSIGDEAFRGCTGLTSVEIPNSVTSIGYNAFRGCSGLTSVTIGSGVTSIEGWAFGDCTDLTSVTCLATNPPTLEKKVWSNVDVSKITLYVPAESVDAYKAADQWKDFSPILHLGEGIDEITNDQASMKNKVSKDGQILILRGDKTYTLQGQEVK